MRKRYRAELANEQAKSPAGSTEESPEARRARIDGEPKRPKRPALSLGAHVWFIDNTGLWYELEVVGRAGSVGRRVTFKPVTGWDSAHEVEWPYGDLLEFGLQSPMYRRLRPMTARPTR